MQNDDDEGTQEDGDAQDTDNAADDASDDGPDETEDNVDDDTTDDTTDTGGEDDNPDTEGEEDAGDDDYTQMGDDNAEPEGNDTEGQGDDDDTGEEDNTTDDTADQEESIENKIKRTEAEIFNTLTDEEKAIKNRELVEDYIVARNTIKVFVEKVRTITVTLENKDILYFVESNLITLNNVITDYIITRYSKKSYIENFVTYQQFVLTLNQLNELISKLKVSDDELKNKEIGNKNTKQYSKY